ncbi:hypothetical protein [Chondromyces apiculatus]|uniref:Outer membrane component of tripartite multidrug resistance system n=1 Tax=Chondromyces apiculatus DSM 436 TaxID=1192034 RepID=A0A017T3D4_9BACT|nr:hypothetical protein [Chondromyces apiculatus]EYF03753.1 Outer membrane component of tripartite multidrug resistance system [Chondromyces apiculatus DSM 436]
MRTRPALLTAAALALLSLPLGYAGRADALPGAGAPTPAAAPPATAQPTPGEPSAGPAAGSVAPTADVERALGAEPFPAEPSKRPTAAEWADAGVVRLTRSGPATAGCRTYRVREWLRFRCPDLTFSAVSLLGGRTEGVAFWITPPKDSDLTRGGEVMFPVRRGDRRAFQILTFGPGYDGPFTLLPAIVLQEQWLEDDPEPTIIAR